MQLDIRLTADRGTPEALALPVFPEQEGQFDEELTAFLEQAEHKGKAGETAALPRPLGTPRKTYLIGVGEGGEAGWRAFGAALTRAASRETSVTVGLPAGLTTAELSGLAEGLRLAAYRFRAVPLSEDKAPKLAEVILAGEADEQAVQAGIVTAEVTLAARDWVNTHSGEKTPEWLAEQFRAAAEAVGGVDVKIWEPGQLADEGFGGILAVGGGSTRGPRLVQLTWAPEGATQHVVLVGKGITFDTGGISIKPAAAMLLMRKDMGGAAAVAAAVLGAARLKLPVKITVLTPLAENAVSESAFRPGDIVTHWGGGTTEILNTDAEGRVVLADALAYAAANLSPDYLIDLATLTGAQNVSLGKKTAALFSDAPDLAKALTEAGEQVGERMWQLPLPADYVDDLRSDVADWVNSTEVGAGTVMAALYLREYAGAARDRWAHLDMSSVAWTEGADKEFSKGATGWGTRMLIRWLSTLA
ncbi:leucyl aminopeptidase family protein [Longispora albida]|uniref:leucyl aminopeptidase family protein n=1 Tax=Longispora albida TaxID=203523 RepID=UPI000363FD9D|nr:leucyl aminopeptidase family protein [Longispora albida]